MNQPARGVREQQTIVLLAAFFQAARMAAGTPSTAESCYDCAQAHMDEAKKRGINVEQVFGE